LLETLWRLGPPSVREVQQLCAQKKGQPTCTTVQTILYRLETKEAARRVKKIGNTHILATALSPIAARRPLIDEPVLR
jgi:predicted transcriptional regulator